MPKNISPSGLEYITDPTDIQALLQERRHCFYVPEEPFSDGHFYPSTVIECVAGHYPTDWDWGTDLNHAQETAKKLNEKRGISEEDALDIIGSSMAASHMA